MNNKTYEDILKLIDLLKEFKFEVECANSGWSVRESRW